jgi:hypothetical protein
VTRRAREAGGWCVAPSRRGGGCGLAGVGGLPRPAQAARRLPMVPGSRGTARPPRRARGLIAGGARRAAPGCRLVTSGAPRRGMQEIRRKRAPGAPKIPKVQDEGGHGRRKARGTRRNSTRSLLSPDLHPIRRGYFRTYRGTCGGSGGPEKFGTLSARPARIVDRTSRCQARSRWLYTACVVAHGETPSSSRRTPRRLA